MAHTMAALSSDQSLEIGTVAADDGTAVRISQNRTAVLLADGRQFR
jgi:hypothetical protein